MSLLVPLKALKIRLFSTFRISKNCCQIATNRLLIKKRPWQSGYSRPSRSFFILNCISCFHMIFVISLAESFALKLDKTVCPEICELFKLYVSIYILYSLDFIFHIFSMYFLYIPWYPHFYCCFCRHFIDNWEEKIDIIVLINVMLYL